MLRGNACEFSSALSNVKSGVSILLAVDLRCHRKLEAYATKSATFKFIVDKALVYGALRFPQVRRDPVSRGLIFELLCPVVDFLRVNLGVEAREHAGVD
jgi:hypothetical protein